jgi:hypothetical protein
MRKVQWHTAVLVLAGLLASALSAHAQIVRPYIGYAYPAGGQQGTTFAVKLGGQGLDDVNAVLVSGTGVSGRVVEYFRRMNPQDIALLSEQLRDLRRVVKSQSGGSQATVMMAPEMNAEMNAKKAASSAPAMAAEMNADMATRKPAATTAAGQDNEKLKLIARIEKRLAESVARPESVAIASLAFIEVTIAPGAKPGAREIRLATPRGMSNPLVFCVGQLPEVSRKPMTTSALQVLGKEDLALRKRPDSEVEDRIDVPCTVNGQIASGEVNRYRFEARKGQRLVLSAVARQLVPYIADAVPGWFQPVLALYDAAGKEVAYNDDYRFKPDPVIFYEVPKDGEYVFAITDAIYRGREDFVYRVSIGELPYITSIFPLGGRAGAPVAVQAKGWNLDKAALMLPGKDAGPGIHPIAACKESYVSNRVPFALDNLPECFEQEPNNDLAHAQKVRLPVMINGRIDRPDDWDVFQFAGHAGETIVAEVYARRLDSPLDSQLKLTDATGKLLAFNDDHEDPQAGVNTHDADSYLMVKLPADGTYYVHLGDTARAGGEEYAYRLRISAPQPDFALLTVPSSLSLRGKTGGAVSVTAIRKDGFGGPIKLGLKNPPEGFSSYPCTLSLTQTSTRLALKAGPDSPLTADLAIEGIAKIHEQNVAHLAVPAEDRMQAFLWRHLVPAEDLKVVIVDLNYRSPAKRARLAHTQPTAPPKVVAAGPVDPATGKPKFTKQQVAGRLRQIELLYEDGLITDAFHDEKVAECEAVQ